MSYRPLKPLAVIFFATTVAGCASLKYEDAVVRDGCWQETQRTWTKGDETVGVENVSSLFDEKCGTTQLDEIKQTVAARTAQEILVRRAVALHPDAVQKIFSTISPDNQGIVDGLGKEGVTIESLLIHKVNALFDVAFSNTVPAEEKSKALGEIVAMHDGSLFPLHAEMAKTVIDQTLEQKDTTIAEIKDQYLGKRKPLLECETKDNVRRCFML
jgi:hypothetical protein